MSSALLVVSFTPPPTPSGRMPCYPCSPQTVPKVQQLVWRQMQVPRAYYAVRGSASGGGSSCITIRPFSLRHSAIPGDYFALCARA